jgi:hypothetical protein
MWSDYGKVVITVVAKETDTTLQAIHSHHTTIWYCFQMIRTYVSRHAIIFVLRGRQNSEIPTRPHSKVWVRLEDYQIRQSGTACPRVSPSPLYCLFYCPDSRHPRQSVRASTKRLPSSYSVQIQSCLRL